MAPPTHRPAPRAPARRGGRDHHRGPGRPWRTALQCGALTAAERLRQRRSAPGVDEDAVVTGAVVGEQRRVGDDRVEGEAVGQAVAGRRRRPRPRSPTVTPFLATALCRPMALRVAMPARMARGVGGARPGRARRRGRLAPAAATRAAAAIRVRAAHGVPPAKDVGRAASSVRRTLGGTASAVESLSNLCHDRSPATFDSATRGPQPVRTAHAVRGHGAPRRLSRPPTSTDGSPGDRTARPPVSPSRWPRADRQAAHGIRCRGMASRKGEFGEPVVLDVDGFDVRVSSPRAGLLRRARRDQARPGQLLPVGRRRHRQRAARAALHAAPLPRRRRRAQGAPEAAAARRAAVGRDGAAALPPLRPARRRAVRHPARRRRRGPCR